MYGKRTNVKSWSGSTFYEYEFVSLDEGGTKKKGVVCYRKYPSSDNAEAWVLLEKCWWDGDTPEWRKLTSDATLDGTEMSEEEVYDFVSRYDYHVANEG